MNTETGCTNVSFKASWSIWWKTFTPRATMNYLFVVHGYYNGTKTSQALSSEATFVISKSVCSLQLTMVID